MRVLRPFEAPGRSISWPPFPNPCQSNGATPSIPTVIRFMPPRFLLGPTEAPRLGLELLSVTWALPDAPRHDAAPYAAVPGHPALGGKRPVAVGTPPRGPIRPHGRPPEMARVGAEAIRHRR